MSCPCCFFLPNHITRHIAENGTPDQQQRAIRNLVLSDSLRQQRSLAAMSFVPKKSVEKIEIYNANHTEDLPGNRIHLTPNTPPTSDYAIAASHADVVYRFYRDVLGRDSLDGNGCTITSTCHFSIKYDNAFWDGTGMRFGDGDGEIFNRFVLPLSVTGHEFQHAVTQSTANLNYQDESGALNEAFSDVIGAIIEQWSLKQQVKDADWVMGREILMPGINGKGIRNLLHPGTAYDDPLLGKDPTVGNMSEYIHTDQDGGGVHLNSTIASRAMVLMLLHLGGNSWDRGAKIIYSTLQKLQPTSVFKDAANVMVSQAGSLFGSQAHDAATYGWREVGVLPQ